MTPDPLQEFIEQRLENLPKSKRTDDIRIINVRFGQKQELELILRKLKNERQIE